MAGMTCVLCQAYCLLTVPTLARSQQTGRASYTATPANRRHGTAIPTLRLQKPFAPSTDTIPVSTANHTSFVNESLQTSILNTSRIPVRTNANTSTIFTSTLRSGDHLHNGSFNPTGSRPAQSLQPHLEELPSTLEELPEDLFASTEVTLQQLSALRSQHGSRYSSPRDSSHRDDSHRDSSHRGNLPAPASPTQPSYSNGYTSVTSSKSTHTSPLHTSPRPTLPSHLAQRLDDGHDDSWTSLGSNLPGLTDDLSYLLAESRSDEVCLVSLAVVFVL
jgi:hypothetical protein